MTIALSADHPEPDGVLIKTGMPRKLAFHTSVVGIEQKKVWVFGGLSAISGSITLS
jgi:hypothetical protein